MTIESTNELITLHQQGSRAATDKLINENKGLVHKIAHKYRTYPAYDPDDVFQEGLLGLIKAFDKFDVTKNIRLSTYASCWIRSYIRKFLVKNASMVRHKNREHDAMSYDRDLYIEDFNTSEIKNGEMSSTLLSIAPDLLDNQHPEIMMMEADKEALVELIKSKVKKKMNPKKYAILESMLKNDYSPARVCEEFGMSRQGVEQQMAHMVKYIKKLRLKDDY
jgi:RNA polymerase sigma factor (sigma-70 family)